VVAALVAAATFQVAVNPPGGVSQDTNDNHCNAPIFELANIEVITLQLYKYNFTAEYVYNFFLFLRPMNGLHNTIELTKIPQGDILFNENRNMVSLQYMYTLGVPNISHR
jgi:hypothetical protein